MRVDGNGGRGTHYEPNSRGALQAQPDFSEPPLEVEGAAARWNHREDTDYFSQPGNLFRMLTPAQQKVLFENTARAIDYSGDLDFQSRWRRVRSLQRL